MTQTPKTSPIEKRYEFTLLFDVRYGNPNGDPDADNMPRIDPETGHGLVTDVCLKRKIRNAAEILRDNATGYRIFVSKGLPLESKNLEAYANLGFDRSTVDDAKRKDPELGKKIAAFMSANFWDIRTFGAVMTTFSADKIKGASAIRGPVQIEFAESIEPISPLNITLTRVTNAAIKDDDRKESEIGSKWIVPYALYRTNGYISANLAQKGTGFSAADLELLWRAIINMFDDDHAAGRGRMTLRELIVFEHNSKFGDCPSWKVLDAVKIKRADPTTKKPARDYSDYIVSIDENALPKTVTCIRKI